MSKLKPYYRRKKLIPFSIYFDVSLYKTLKRFAKADERSLQKTIQRIIYRYVQERLVREISEPKS